jgi:hypothetical protein
LRSGDSLQELANPYVISHLDFYPEDAHGLGIYKFSQSMKWLKDLPAELRVQMVEVAKKHYYIFEPAMLKSGQMVIPMFFYKDGSEMYAKCAIPRVTHQDSPPQVHIQAVLDSAFDLPSLVAINVTELDVAFPEIYIGQLGDLLHVCTSQIWGESYLSETLRASEIDKLPR